MIEQIKQALEETNLVRGVVGVPSAEKDEWLRYLLGEVERLTEVLEDISFGRVEGDYSDMRQFAWRAIDPDRED